MKIDTSTLSAGEKVLWRFGVTEPEHIDLEAIADQYNVIVRYRPLAGADARIVGVGDRAVISVNTSSSLQRQRFSIGHELGHWIPGPRSEGLQACSQADISPKNQLEKTIEADANRFSSDLLLPPYLMRPRARSVPCNIDSAIKLAKIFRASVTATSISLTRLSETPAALVVHSTRGREWYLRNLAWPTDAFPANQISHETKALDLLFKGKPGDKTTDLIERADRWVSCRDAYRQSIKAQSVKLPNDLVLSLIRFVT